MNKPEKAVEKTLSEWVMVTKDGKDYRRKTIEHGNTTINVYRPVFADGEQAKREKAIMHNIAKILVKYDDPIEE